MHGPEADFLIRLAMLIIGSLIVILQTIGIHYFREIKHLFFHHRHKDCECDKPGKGDVFIPTEYQR